MTYTVGEIAKKLNVAPSTLRYYDKEGLLPFVERSVGGIRVFHDEDMDWLELIECMKHTGMPIKEIKHFIDYCVEGDSRINESLTPDDVPVEYHKYFERKWRADKESAENGEPPKKYRAV